MKIKTSGKIKNI